jgi:hypothetical protein
VAVAGLGAATVLLGSVVWASTSSQRGTEGEAVAVNTPSAIASSPSVSPVTGVPVDPVLPSSIDEMTPEIRALWEAAQAPPAPDPKTSPSPSPDKKPSPSAKPPAPPAPSSPPGGGGNPSPSQPSGPTPSPSFTVSPSPNPSHVNHIPDANDDSATVDEDMPGTIRVLSNDTGLEDGVVGVVITRQPSHGTVAVTGNDVLYTPDHNYNGLDRFSYSVADTDGESSTATVNIRVNPVSDETPLAADDFASTDLEKPVTIDILRNDTRFTIDRLDSVDIVSQPNHGSVHINGQNEAVYTPDNGFSGFDSFTYRITDGDGDTSEATVTIRVDGPPPPPPPSPTPPPDPTPIPTP